MISISITQHRIVCTRVHLPVHVLCTAAAAGVAAVAVVKVCQHLKTHIFSTIQLPKQDPSVQTEDLIGDYNDMSDLTPLFAQHPKESSSSTEEFNPINKMANIDKELNASFLMLISIQLVSIISCLYFTGEARRSSLKYIMFLFK